MRLYFDFTPQLMFHIVFEQLWLEQNLNSKPDQNFEKIRNQILKINLERTVATQSRMIDYYNSGLYSQNRVVAN